MLATAAEDQTVRLWEVATGRQQAVLRPKGIALAVAFTPDGNSLVSGGDGEDLSLWE
jgi:WD40 repeat protein